MNNTLHSLLLIGVMAVGTFLTRSLPFFLFPPHRKAPAWVLYLGKVLPPAVIAMLVVYCLKEVRLSAFPFGLPEALAIALIVVLHVWKRNTLLSIGAGTIVYMLLVQTVFVTA